MTSSIAYLSIKTFIFVIRRTQLYRCCIFGLFSITTKTVKGRGLSLQKVGNITCTSSSRRLLILFWNNDHYNFLYQLYACCW